MDSLLLHIERPMMSNMDIIKMRSPFLISFFLLLLQLAHARSLSENSPDLFTQIPDFKMPTSLPLPFSTCAPHSSSCNGLLIATQYGRPTPSPPPPPSSGPDQSGRSSTADPGISERLCLSFKKTYYRKRLSSSVLSRLESSSLEPHVLKLCNEFMKMMDYKKPSLPLPKSPRSLSLASS